MATVIGEFDSVAVRNASIQFIRGGTQSPGTRFGCVGTISGTTTSRNIIKNCEGVEQKRLTIPQSMELTLSAHVPVAVLRNVFGLTSEGLKEGIAKYGTTSVGDRFVLTADVVDEFENVTKLIAFSNASNSAGLTFAITNGQEEVAELDFTFTALADTQRNFYYEAFVTELTDDTVAAQWHTMFTSELVNAPIPSP